MELIHFTGQALRPALRQASSRLGYDYRNNLVREERDDNPFSNSRWQYDDAGRLLTQDGSLRAPEQWQWEAAGNPLDNRTAEMKVSHNRLTHLNGIRWHYDIHGRTSEKDNDQTRWRYDDEHRLSEVLSEPRDRNKPRVKGSFVCDAGKAN